MIPNHSDRREVQLGFTEQCVQEGQHICQIFSDDTERKRIMMRFVESGLAAGEKVLCLAEQMTPEEVLGSLEEAGVDGRALTSQFTVAEAAPTYFPAGVFDADHMLDTVRSFYRRGVEDEGYAGGRAVGEIDWRLVDGRAQEAALMEYEARLTDVVAECHLTTCCQYDARRLDGHVMMDLLAVHPLIILRGQVVANPFYVDPDTFLSEYRARQSA